MKFRSRIARDGLTILLNVVSTVHKLGEVATILLDENSVRLAVVPESIESARAYAELNASTLFGEYRIESQQDNQIIFECNLTLLIKALTSGKYSSHCIIKLVKRQEKPCLSLEFKASESMISVDICHDIPIKLMRIQDDIMQSISPPQISPPKVAFYLPKNKLLRTIIDRLTKFHKIVHLKAYHQIGRLQIQVTNPSVKIETFYHGLQVRDFQGETTGQQPAFQSSSSSGSSTNVSVNIKRLVMILDYQQMIYQDATLCKSLLLLHYYPSYNDMIYAGFTPREALVLHISLSPSSVGSVTYYLPVLLSAEDNDDEEEKQQADPSIDGLESESLGTTPSDIALAFVRERDRVTGSARVRALMSNNNNHNNKQNNNKKKTNKVTKTRDKTPVKQKKRYLLDDEAQEEEEAEAGEDGETGEEEDDPDITRLEDEEEEEEVTPIYYSDQDNTNTQLE